MYEILDRITRGEGKNEDVEALEELSWIIENASLCALGTSAPNPVLTTIKYFREEYVAHIKDKKCPARVCKPLITYRIDKEKCTGCVACLKKCPQEAVSGKPKELHQIDQTKCIKCGICFDVCKFDAVIVE
jgi:ferredoxin